MKNAIAIAKAKLKKINTSPKRPESHLAMEDEMSRIGLGSLMITGVILGIGGIIALVSGFFSSNGPLHYFYSWLASAFLG